MRKALEKLDAVATAKRAEEPPEAEPPAASSPAKVVPAGTGKVCPLKRCFESSTLAQLFLEIPGRRRYIV